ncbi:hypothetical protein P167DRAFT_609948 [Morchella conica CCBAS932]|uniref:Uncharacterized protein n=1 Tax=Morchella conica CCBAS932 TaxID=1392247 RepID=A0A3N4KLJ6_9PEZI|nr:hypothetical protein P167DRAFT_609948 [Morchella conica CCBAS932]
MSSLPAPPPLRLANDLITACTTHFSNFSQLRGKRKNSNHRKPLCHEFGRFRLWAHGFKGVMPECDYLLDEVLQEAIYLKEPTIMLLASFAGCLLADCLSKVGNDNTRGQLELSLSHVNREYPNLEVPLSREWNTQVAAIGEFRKCVDDLFDMLPTLDNVLETIQERGRHRVKAVEGDQTPPQTTPTTEGAVDVPCVPGVGYRYQSLGSVYALPTGMSSTALPLTAGERQDMGDSLSEEMEDPLDKAAREEISAHPKLVEGVHHDIYQRYIKDRFPQAIEELDIESFAKGNVECYERLIKCVEEEASLARNPKPPPSSGVPQTIGDSGVGSSLPRTMLPPPPPTALLAPPGSISSSSQSTICSTSSEPRNRRLVPRIPEHSQFSTGFKCAFCGGAQRPTRTSHAWR